MLTQPLTSELIFLIFPPDSNIFSVSWNCNMAIYVMLNFAQASHVNIIPLFNKIEKTQYHQSILIPKWIWHFKGWYILQLFNNGTKQ